VDLPMDPAALHVVAQRAGLPAAPELGPRPAELAPKPGTLPPWDELHESDMTLSAKRFTL
jgi:hypothetical protein